MTVGQRQAVDERLVAAPDEHQPQEEAYREAAKKVRQSGSLGCSRSLRDEYRSALIHAANAMEVAAEMPGTE